LATFINRARTDADMSLGCLLVMMLPPDTVASRLSYDKPLLSPRFHPW
jgi:hypothetical protein